MPPQVATVLTALLILLLFGLDGKRKEEGVSRAVYLPFFWFLFAASRYLSQWLSLGAPVEATVESYFEGSPLDRLVFAMLMVGGIAVLLRRQLRLGQLVRDNPWVALYFAFGLLSIFWSDYPFTSFKRFLKALGNPLMALVLLSEARPDRALAFVIRRAAYLLLPLSVLFIKYYPDIGRQYHVTGLQMSVGVTTTKNQLGQLSLICGIYFAWELLVARSSRRARLTAIVVSSVITVWLLYKANSMTSLVALSAAVLLLGLSRLPSIRQKPSRVLSAGLSIALVLILLQLTLNLSNFVITGLIGRDSTLTTRVPMWYGLLAMVKRPILGAGYESFWLGERLAALWQQYGMLHQAHNGYLEVFLNLGAVGLFLIAGTLLSGFVRLRRRLDVDAHFSVLRFAFLVTVVIHNWAEASFYGVNNLWLLMFLAVFRDEKSRAAERAVSTTASGELDHA